MPNQHTARSQIAKEAIRRFSHLPAQTIARHLLYTYPDLYENDLEKARSSVRHWLGKNGKRSRETLSDRALMRTSSVPMPQTWRKVRTAYHLPVGTGLLLGDAHVPFHEPKPLEAAIQAGQAEKVDWVFLNGDWQDCAAVSYWPTAQRRFHKEVEAVIDSLDFLRSQFPKQKIIYKPGNHEYRLPRYFLRHAPELVESPLAAMETVLGFEKRKIEFLDYQQIVYAGKLPIIHGHEVSHINKAVNAARGLFLKIKTYGACSHCHSTSMHTPKTIEGKLLTTWSFGCLCDLEPDYNPYGSDWNWGFGIINVEKNGNFEVINRRVLPNGKVV